MKVFIVLLAIVGAAFAGTVSNFEIQGRSISSQIEDAIVGIRDQMPCGFPEFGVGPLAPARISEKDVHLQTESFGADGGVEDFALWGINEFDVNNVKANALTSIIENTVVSAINDNQKEISDKIEENFVPRVNAVLKGHKIWYLFSLLGGGFGSTGSKCVPPPEPWYN
uniref:Uncharacterized protein n=1 Tax=Megaselia scalaris TaxID=36166 RepID=T1GVK4_MEGSC